MGTLANSEDPESYSRKKYLGGRGGGGRRQATYFLWVVGAESFQIIWIIGVRPNLMKKVNKQCLLDTPAQ